MLKAKNTFGGRFTFTVCMNDNIVCQRFFDIPENMELDTNAFRSVDLKRCMQNDDHTGVVDMIKADLLGKTQQYLKMVAGNATETAVRNGEKVKVPVNRMKLVGFITDEEAKDCYVPNENGEIACTNALHIFADSIEGSVPLENGRVVTKEYINIESDFQEQINEDEPYILKVELKFKNDDTNRNEILYSQIWDAKYYPRLVRSNINLSNRSPFKDDSKELLKPHNFILHQLTKGREDLITLILRKLTYVLSKRKSENGVAINKKYTYPKKYVQAKKQEEAYIQGWWNATYEKWRDYQSRWSTRN